MIDILHRYGRVNTYSAVYIAQVRADHPPCMSNKRDDCKRFDSDSHGNSAAVTGDIMLLHGGTQ